MEPWNVGSEEDAEGEEGGDGLTASETIITAESASYGGSYYLSPSVLAKTDRIHSSSAGRGESSNNYDTSVSFSSPRRIHVSYHLASPAFFQMGNDFPASRVEDMWVADGSTQKAEEDGEEGPKGGASSGWADATKGGVVLPCVSLQVPMMVSARRGSAALRELQRMKAIARKNREAMDTTASSLTRLTQKNVFGGGGGGDESGGQEEADSHPTGMDDDEEGGPREKHQSNSRRATAPQGVRDEERIQEVRRSLPIYQVKSAVLRCIADHPITILTGETGSGKTTQLVQYLYEYGYAATSSSMTEGEGEDEGGEGSTSIPTTATTVATSSDPSAAREGVRHRKRRPDCRIACTQPRRLAAIGVARRVAEEMNCGLGTTVGYRIHLDDCSSEATRILFMTDGVLLREMVHDPDLRAYSIIVLDETHERSIETDVLMGTIRRAVARRRGDLKLILTSATLDTERFARYFFGAPVFNVPGRVFPVKEVYPSSPVDDYVAEAVYRVCQIHLSTPMTGELEAQPAQDILVFMSGRDDVMGTCELIHQRLLQIRQDAADRLLLLPCLSEGGSNLTTATTARSGSEAEEQPMEVGVLDACPKGYRKCVVATNVAETSLTIDGVRYVIDAGYVKASLYRPSIGMNTLQRYPVSQAQAAQRKGRAGRTSEGICFRLYTEHQFRHEMLEQTVPVIQRSSLDSVVLLLKSVGVEHLRSFELMDSPPPSTIRRSLWTLWLLGFVDDAARVTALGRLALEFATAPSLAKLLLEGAAAGVGEEVCGIAAMLTADPKHLLDVPKGKEEKATQQHARFSVPQSDHLTYLNILRHFQQVYYRGSSATATVAAERWAREHFLHYPTLIRAEGVYQQLLERAIHCRLLPQSTPLRQPAASSSAPFSQCWDTVRRCLATAYFLQSAQQGGLQWNDYTPLLHQGVVSYLHPASSVSRSAVDMPTCLVYHDLLSVESVRSAASASGTSAAGSPSMGSNTSSSGGGSDQKQYLMVVTAVEPAWLVAASPIFQLQSSAYDAAPASSPPPSGLPSSSPSTTTSTTLAINAPIAAPAAAAAAAAKQSKPPERANLFSGMKRRRNI